MRGSLVVLCEQTTGKPGESVGNAQANDSGKMGIDGAGTHHVRVVARCADGKTEFGAQEET